MNRPRSTAKGKGLPPNLYAAGAKAYRYKHPLTGKFHGMGQSKAKAVQAANRLNALLMPESNLVDDVMGKPLTLADYAIDRYQLQVLAERKLADSTRAVYAGLTRKLVELFGEIPLLDLSTLDISTALNPLPPKIANKLRSHLGNILKSAMSDGHIETNPALVMTPRVSEKDRKRMTLLQFQSIRLHACLWMQNAMDLGLHTLQRRSDILNMQFDQIDGNTLCVIQQKTKKYDSGYLRITLSPELIEIIRHCRDNIPSPFLVHHRPSRGRRAVHNKEHWTQIAKQTFTREFDKARTACGLFTGWDDGTAPTFHEIRALGIKLYRDQGIDPQHLAGHASAEMTKNYDSDHADIRWTEVSAGLKL